MMKNPIFDLKMGGRLIHKVDLYTSKYGIWMVQFYANGCAEKASSFSIILCFQDAFLPLLDWEPKCLVLEKCFLTILVLKV